MEQIQRKVPQNSPIYSPRSDISQSRERENISEIDLLTNMDLLEVEQLWKAKKKPSSANKLSSKQNKAAKKRPDKKLNFNNHRWEPPPRNKNRTNLENINTLAPKLSITNLEFLEREAHLSNEFKNSFRPIPSAFNRQSESEQPDDEFVTNVRLKSNNKRLLERRKQQQVNPILQSNATDETKKKVQYIEKEVARYLSKKTDNFLKNTMKTPKKKRAKSPKVRTSSPVGKNLVENHLNSLFECLKTEMKRQKLPDICKTNRNDEWKGGKKIKGGSILPLESGLSRKSERVLDDFLDLKNDLQRELWQYKTEADGSEAPKSYRQNSALSDLTTGFSSTYEQKKHVRLATPVKQFAYTEVVVIPEGKTAHMVELNEAKNCELSPTVENVVQQFHNFDSQLQDFQDRYKNYFDDNEDPFQNPTKNDLVSVTTDLFNEPCAKGDIKKRFSDKVSILPKGRPSCLDFRTKEFMARMEAVNTKFANYENKYWNNINELGPVGKQTFAKESKIEKKILPEAQKRLKGYYYFKSVEDFEKDEQKNRRVSNVSRSENRFSLPTIKEAEVEAPSTPCQDIWIRRAKVESSSEESVNKTTLAWLHNLEQKREIKFSDPFEDSMSQNKILDSHYPNRTEYRVGKDANGTEEGVLEEDVANRYFLKGSTIYTSGGLMVSTAEKQEGIEEKFDYSTEYPMKNKRSNQSLFDKSSYGDIENERFITMLDNYINVEPDECSKAPLVEELSMQQTSKQHEPTKKYRNPSKFCTLEHKKNKSDTSCQDSMASFSVPTVSADPSTAECQTSNFESISINTDIIGSQMRLSPRSSMLLETSFGSSTPRKSRIESDRSQNSDKYKTNLSPRSSMEKTFESLASTPRKMLSQDSFNSDHDMVSYLTYHRDKDLYKNVISSHFLQKELNAPEIELDEKPLGLNHYQKDSVDLEVADFEDTAIPQDFAIILDDVKSTTESLTEEMIKNFFTPRTQEQNKEVLTEFVQNSELLMSPRIEESKSNYRLEKQAISKSDLARYVPSGNSTSGSEDEFLDSQDALDIACEVYAHRNENLKPPGLEDETRNLREDNERLQRENQLLLSKLSSKSSEVESFKKITPKPMVTQKKVSKPAPLIDTKSFLDEERISKMGSRVTKVVNNIAETEKKILSILKQRHNSSTNLSPEILKPRKGRQRKPLIGVYNTTFKNSDQDRELAGKLFTPLKIPKSDSKSLKLPAIGQKKKTEAGDYFKRSMEQIISATKSKSSLGFNSQCSIGLSTQNLPKIVEGNDRNWETKVPKLRVQELQFPAVGKCRKVESREVDPKRSLNKFRLSRSQFSFKDMVLNNR